MLKVVLKQILVWMKYLVLIFILILTQIFLLSFKEKNNVKDPHVRFNTQFVKSIQFNERNNSREDNFYDIWSERQRFIVREGFNLFSFKSLEC